MRIGINAPNEMIPLARLDFQKNLSAGAIRNKAQLVHLTKMSTHQLEIFRGAEILSNMVVDPIKKTSGD